MIPVVADIGMKFCRTVNTVAQCPTLDLELLQLTERDPMTTGTLIKTPEQVAAERREEERDDYRRARETVLEILAVQTEMVTFAALVAHLRKFGISKHHALQAIGDLRGRDIAIDDDDFVTLLAKN